MFCNNRQQYNSNSSEQLSCTSHQISSANYT